MRYAYGHAAVRVTHIIREDGGRSEASRGSHGPGGRVRALCSGQFTEAPLDPAVPVCAKCDAKRQEWVERAREVLATYADTAI